MTKREKQWKAERLARYKANKKLLDTMSEQQRNAIKEAQDVLRSTYCMITETHDLYMSDIGKIESAMYGIQNAFSVSENY
tara:strand:- start:22218 stop:22457 length:240 start_codon:yes stop_codon:yes gene_type:complete